MEFREDAKRKVLNDKDIWTFGSVVICLSWGQDASLAITLKNSLSGISPNRKLLSFQSSLFFLPGIPLLIWGFELVRYGLLSLADLTLEVSERENWPFWMKPMNFTLFHPNSFYKNKWFFLFLRGLSLCTLLLTTKGRMSGRREERAKTEGPAWI